VRFSILLPTRNRLEYLRQAVETVRRQSFADWEVVVSDNDSEDESAQCMRDVGVQAEIVHLKQLTGDDVTRDERRKRRDDERGRPEVVTAQ